MSPCGPATRAHAFQHVPVVPVHSGTFWTYTRGRFESTHGFFFQCATTHTTPRAHHNTRHKTQHTTTHHNSNNTRRQRQRERKKTEKERKTREEKIKRREEKRRSRDQEKIKLKEKKRKIRCVVCVVVWFCFFLFLSFSKLPDPRIISNFQTYHYQPWKQFNFPGNFCLYKVQSNLFFKNYFGNHFVTHGTTNRNHNNQLKPLKTTWNNMRVTYLSRTYTIPDNKHNHQKNSKNETTWSNLNNAKITQLETNNHKLTQTNTSFNILTQ